MSNFDPVPPRLDVLLDAADRVADLPQSQAFEQVMYEQMTNRVSRFASDSPIIFHPRLMRTQFPENLKDCFISSSNLRIDGLKVAQLLTSPTASGKDIPPRQSKMLFDVDRVTYSFTTDGTDAVITIETQNGPSSKRLKDADFTAFLASIVFAMQYDPDSTDEFHLAEDPLILRREDSDIDEGLVERIIMTMGDLGGHAETVTTSLFDTVGDMLEVELIIRESPRTSGVNNSMSLSRITGASSNKAIVRQNEVAALQSEFLAPDRSINHYAEEVSLDLINDVQEAVIIDPEEDFEKYAAICANFITHIGPLVKPYEDSEITY